MAEPTSDNRIRHLAYDQTSGRGPGLVFLSGFASDKGGTKAMYLDDWARSTGRAFLRFDYSGHGASSGEMARLGIADWVADAEAVILSLTRGRQILVGSSMGGWIALLLARRIPDRIAGMVTIAAAPDFTEDRLWPSLSNEDRDRIMRDGHINVASEYSDDPNVVSRKLIEDGRQNLVLRDPLHLPFPTRMLQGTRDETIPVATANRLFEHAEGPDVQLNVVAGEDHRFSSTGALELIREAIEDVELKAGQSGSGGR